MSYVELHCHSAYSFLDGASQPEELAVRAAELGYEALALAAVERGAGRDRDEDVLQAGAARVVRVRVAGGDGPDAERFGEVAQCRVAACVAALVGALQLDVEAVAAEGGGDAGGRVRVDDAEAVPRAAGEADEALVPLEQRVERQRGRQPA